MKRTSNVGLAVIIIGVVAIILAAAIIFVSSKIQSRVSLNIGDGVFTAKIASTQLQRDKALGGISDFATDQAFIMAYPSDNQWPIGMKDMKVSVDIIWLDKDKKAVYIVTNASPDGVDVVFTPKSAARYVIELPAGSVDNMNIKTGRAAIFDISTVEVK